MAHDTPHDFGAASTVGYQPTAEVGKRIGPYKLLQELGEGGMGTVWLAEQTAPVQRRVALKIIKTGNDSKPILARFDAERQALALMDHPNIAKVLDAGTTAAGQPYFVMELVKGLPITKFCDQEHRAPRDRLELFIAVCQAVQHAHQKGIIHRDLKPSNILVSLVDGKPMVKVIDFGVAKATGQKLTERTMFTEVGQIIGTLEYMAPEQAELNNLDIDTRADVYSLGILLYELLTGRPPFTRRELEGAGLGEMLRMIREVEPPKPSTKISSSGELARLAADRQMEPRKLSQLVQGDLDWIIMKCLEKDRGRRYETANGLAADIRRYLADEPVLAGPPSASYRLRKLLRKHRTAALVACSFLVLLLAATGISLGLAWWADHERTRAEAAEALAKANLIKAEEAAAAERQAADAATKAKTLADERRLTAEKAENAAQEERKKAEAARQKAIQEAAIAKTLADILQISGDLFIDPDGGGFSGSFGPRKDMKVSKLLDRAVERLDDRKDPPAVAAAVRATLAKAYSTVAENAKAVSQWEKALGACQRHFGPDHAQTLHALRGLALVHQEMKAAKKAVPLFEQLLDKRQKVSGADDIETLQALSDLGGAYRDARDFAKAEPLFSKLYEALKRREAKMETPDRSWRLQVAQQFVQLYSDWGRPEDAARWRKEVQLLTLKKG